MSEEESLIDPKKREVPEATLNGRRVEIPQVKLGDPKDHWHLAAVCIHLPTDYEPYGYRYRDASDCSCGCKWFLPLQVLPSDWGVCVNPLSPRCGLLTFEHQGCQFFEFDPNLEEADDAENQGE